MSSIRIWFTRGDEVKYISHLDLMKAFERALRRSNIPVAYTQGFNPHHKIVFGLPLSVGVTSEAEYADIELERPMSSSEFVDTLNKQLPRGLRILKARRKETKDNIMAKVVLASYRILACVDCDTGNGETDIDEITKQVTKFMSNEVLKVKRQSKRGLREIDIRPLVHKLDVVSADSLALDTGGNERLYCFTALLSAGSKANLKPELLMQAFSDITGTGIDVKRIHRTGLFADKGGKPADPLDDDILLNQTKWK